MKILMVSWEYPPLVIGGLGRHVHHLATELVADGHDVVVLSRRPTGTDPSTHPTTDEANEGVRVIAAAQDPHEFTFGADMMAWTLAMGHAMTRAGLSLKDWRPDVVHAHDWLVAHPAIAAGRGAADHFGFQQGNPGASFREGQGRGGSSQAAAHDRHIVVAFERLGRPIIERLRRIQPVRGKLHSLTTSADLSGAIFEV